MTDLFKDLDDAIAEIDRVKTKLRANMVGKLADVKDASYVTVLSENPKCFIMNSSKLGNDWSVEHHDLKHQAKCLMEYIETNSLELVTKELRHIKENKKWSSGHMKKKTGIATFNDEFIAQIFGEN